MEKAVPITERHGKQILTWNTVEKNKRDGNTAFNAYYDKRLANDRLFLEL